MKNDLIKKNRVFLMLAAVTGVILLIPAVAMQFTSEVNWGPEDFIALSVLVFGVGTIFVFVARILPRKYRSRTALFFLVVLLILWVHLAVGIVDTWPLAGS